MKTPNLKPEEKLKLSLMESAKYDFERPEREKKHLREVVRSIIGDRKIVLTDCR